MKSRSIAIFLFSLIVLSISCSIEFNFDDDRTDRTTFEVFASEGWQKTEIHVERGDELSITSLSGSWSPWAGGFYDAIGSGGDPRCDCNVVMGVSHAALIGRIGEYEPFLVGEEYRRIVGEEGDLYLGINDTDIFDNSGSITVLITKD